MRKRFVVVVLVPALVFLITVALFVDSWVESGLEYAAEHVVGARVEIDNVDIRFFPISVGWTRLQVADPSDTWSNLFETGAVRFTMDAGQLLRAKFIIETISVENFVLGTTRLTDGALEKKITPASPAAIGEQPPGDRTPDALSAKTASTPVFDLAALRAQLNLDSLTNPSNLETYRLIDSLERELTAIEKQWKTSLDDIESTQKSVRDIASRVRSIDVNAISSVEAAQKAYGDAQSAYEQTNSVVGNLQLRTREIAVSFESFSADLRSIDGAAQRDFNNVVSAARLPDVSMRGLAEIVLGAEILKQAESYLGYVDLARDAIPSSASDASSKSAASSGRMIIHFPEEQSYPKLWIKEIFLSGGTDSLDNPSYFYASGSILNVSTDQRLTGEAMTADLRARNSRGTSAAFQATFDRRLDVPHDDYTIDVVGIEMGEFPLGSPSFLPSKMTGGDAQTKIHIDVPGEGLESTARISFSSVGVSFDRDPKNAVERLTRDVLTGVRGFFVDLRVWKDPAGRLDVSFATDLDSQLSGRARQVIGAEVTRIQADIKRRVDAEIAKKRRVLESAYAEKRSEAETKLRSLEKDIRSQIDFVEAKKKEFEDRIEKEKKRVEEELKKKAGDALKGLFKKND